MRSFWGTLLANVAVMAAVLAAYHWTLGAGASTPAGGARSDGDSLLSLEREVDRLAADVAARRGQGLGSRIDERLAALEQRLQGLEGGASEASTGAGGTPPADRTWTEGDLAAVRSMLAELDVRRARDQEDEAIRVMLKTLVGDLDETQVRSAVALIYAHNETIKALWKEALAGGRTAPSAESLEKADAAKRALEKDLKAVLTADAVEKLRPRFSDLPRDLK